MARADEPDVVYETDIVYGKAGDEELKPRRPYLLRAVHEWISDSGYTTQFECRMEEQGGR